MKKLLLAIPAIVLLAAACNSSQPTTEQTQPTPTPQQQVTQTPTPTTSTPTSETKDTSDCINTTYGYELTVPQGWKVWTRGEGEARPAKCSEGLASYYFAQDLFNNGFHNQINLQVMTAQNQSKSFWHGFNSLDTYISSKGLSNQVQSYGTIDGEKLAWFKPGNNSTTDGQYIDAYTFHNNELFIFTFYDVNSNIKNNFVSSFKFTK